MLFTFFTSIIKFNWKPVYSRKSRPQADWHPTCLSHYWRECGPSSVILESNNLLNDRLDFALINALEFGKPLLHPHIHILEFNRTQNTFRLLIET